MTKQEAKTISEIFGAESFKFGGLSPELTIKVVRIQIIVDPIAKSVKDAIETAVKGVTTPRFKELNEKVQAGKVNVGTPEAAEFFDLREAFDKKFNEAIKPTLEAKVEATIPTLTEEEFKELCKANSFTGSTPVTLFSLLVDTTSKV